MSNYQGNIIIKNPTAPTGPAENGSAPGIWKLSEAMTFKRQGIWPTQGVLASDPYFPYVSLLLSTTSLGNANNNLFVDSSGAFNPLSRNGNTTQGSVTPYSPNWSNYFDGSSTLTFSSISLAGDFTIEAWVYYTSTSGNPTFVGANPPNNQALRRLSGKHYFYFQGPSITGTIDIPTNQWVHLAVTRSSNTVRIFTNGVLDGSASLSGTFSVFCVGGVDTGTDRLTGYGSNVRIVNGTAVYTSTFTPPTSPLTAISGTVLLTCQSNRFRDASSSPYTITVNGTPRVTDFSPFSPTSAITYNQSDITNWSGYFNGSTDYLTAPTGSPFQFGTGSFTVEAWIYVNEYQAYDTCIYDNCPIGGSGGRNNAFVWFITSSGTLRTFSQAAFGTASTSTVPLSQWVHVALVRNGSSTATYYINGQSAGTTTIGADVTTGGCVIARLGDANSGYLKGWISNMRILKGVAQYTSNFTPPTSALTAISGTSLLTLQNAAFTDNSTNNLVITPFGQATVTGNSPFNTVGYWSNYFDGSGDWLSVPDSASLQMGSSDFTYECWLYPTAIPNTYQSFIEKRGVGGYAGVLLAIKSSGKYSILVASGSSTWGIVDESSINVTLNAWQHIAVVRSGSTFSVYLNGVRQINTTISFSVYDNTSVQGIGAGDSSGNQPFYGYLSNVRIVKGTAVYSGASFTPPTTPLTAISGTSLLTCQNGRFIDNSTNNFTITVNGNTSAQSFDPFYTSTIASNGGSMYFDGSGDYLAVPNSANLQFGTSNFTVECWFNSNVSTTDTHSTVIGKWGSGFNTTGDWALRSRFSNTNRAAVTLRYSGGWYDITTSINVNDGAWHHLAFVRENSTTLKIYVDGVLGATRTISASDIVGSSATLSIGGPAVSTAGEGAITGYVSNARITTGTALYTAAFTPPTSVLTPSANTTLLVNGMNAGIYDATAINDMETVGNAQVTTAVSKFGGSSVYFDGTGDYLTSNAASDLYTFGTGDFTIEMWFNLSSFSSLQILYDSRPTSTDGLYPLIYVASGGGSVVWQISATAQITGTATLSTGVWYHLAVSRSSGSTKMFLNGTQVGSTYADTNAYLNSGTTRPFIGGSSYSAGTLTVNGYIEEVRVTKGVGRYTSNFTPPTQAFPTF